MHRHGDKKLLINLFKKIKKEVPNAVIRTTLIVGFPSETDEDVDNLVSFIKDIRFDHLGVFKYSKEEGTLSSYMKEQIPSSIKTKRYNKVMKAQSAISFSLNQKHVGEEMDMLVTSYDEDNMCYIASCYLFAPDDIDGKVYLYSSKELEIGQIVRGKIVNASIYDLDAELVI